MIDYAARKRTRVRMLGGEHVHWVHASHRRRYISLVILSTPPWVDLAALRAMQAEARRLTETTGVLHELDHIVPLSHSRVCGLTVPWNLRILTSAQNGAKSNGWCPEQMELYDE